MLKRIDSHTYQKEDGFNSEACLIIINGTTPPEKIDFNVVYKKEAEQIYSFLASVFCDRTLIELEDMLKCYRKVDC